MHSVISKACVLDSPLSSVNKYIFSEKMQSVIEEGGFIPVFPSNVNVEQASSCGASDR